MNSLRDLFELIAILVISILLAYFFYYLADLGGQPALKSWDQIKLYTLLSVTLFIPLSAIAYCLFRREVRSQQLRFQLTKLGKDKNEINKLIEIYGHDTSLTSHSCSENGESADKVNDNQKSIIAFTRLIIAVMLSTAMTFTGMSILLYGEDIKLHDDNKPFAFSLFLGGMEAINSHTDASPNPNEGKIDPADTKNGEKPDIAEATRQELLKYERGALLMFGMASMGAILFGLRHIVRRYLQFDLYSGVYYSLAVRIILASIVAVVIYHSIDALSDSLYALLEDGRQREGTGNNDKISSILPALALLIGLFPQRGITFLKQKFPFFSEESNPTAQRLPLSMIEGITQHDVIRLEELGVENCYHLAERELIPMIIASPYSVGRMINWIAQAKLCVYFKDTVGELRSIGIRTILDLHYLIEGQKEAGSKDNNHNMLNNLFHWKNAKDEASKPIEQRLVEEAKITIAQATHILKEIEKDKSIKALVDYYEKIGLEMLNSNKNKGKSIIQTPQSA